MVLALALTLVTMIQVAPDPSPPAPAAPPAAAAPRVVLISGENEYDSEASLSALAHLLTERHGMTTALASSHSPDSVRGLDPLATADLAVLFVRSRTWPEADWKRLADFLSRGGALVALRSSLAAFAYPPESPLAAENEAFPTRLFGTPWQSDLGPATSTDVILTPRPRNYDDHDLLHNVRSTFHVRSWLVRVQSLPDDVNVIARGSPVESEQEKKDGGAKKGEGARGEQGERAGRGSNGERGEKAGGGSDGKHGEQAGGEQTGGGQAGGGSHGKDGEHTGGGQSVDLDARRGADASYTFNPVAWTRVRPDGGRTFYTSLGHPEDFEVVEFRRLLVNGIYWTLKRPVAPGGPPPKRRRGAPANPTPPQPPEPPPPPPPPPPPTTELDVTLPETNPLTSYDVSTPYLSDWTKPIESQHFPPEEGIAGFNDVQWIHVASPDGALDFRRFDPTSKQGTIFARSTLHAAGPRQLELVLQSDDAIELFVDKKSCFTRQELRTLSAGCDLVPLDLPDGDHELTFKVMNAGDAWGLRVRTRDLTEYRKGWAGGR